MFRVSGFRDVGMPTLKMVETPEEGFAWAEERGFRDHVFVEPLSAGAGMSSAAWWGAYEAYKAKVDQASVIVAAIEKAA